jgi:hypothetical protein
MSDNFQTSVAERHLQLGNLDARRLEIYRPKL